MSLHPSVKSSWAPGGIASEEFTPWVKAEQENLASLTTVDVCNIYYGGLLTMIPADGATLEPHQLHALPEAIAVAVMRSALKDPICSHDLLFSIRTPLHLTIYGTKDTSALGPIHGPRLALIPQLPGQPLCPESHPQRPRLWL